jgi:hypothetical protein
VEGERRAKSFLFFDYCISKYMRREKEGSGVVIHSFIHSFQLIDYCFVGTRTLKKY